MRLLQRIRAENLLSFGPDGLDLELKPLNVLIGPNGSGKSNLIELVGLLQALPTNLQRRIAAGGGIAEWLWKRGDGHCVALLDVYVRCGDKRPPLRQWLEFRGRAQRFELQRECIQTDGLPGASVQSSIVYEQAGDQRVIRSNGAIRPLAEMDFKGNASILAQLKDPTQYPEVTWLADEFGRICIYSDWTVGRGNPVREPQRTDDINDVVSEDYLNLALILSRLRSSDVSSLIVQQLNDLYGDIDDFGVYIEGGTAQIYLKEDGIRFPATRLSDGTLRYLCLLAILCDPKPPPLVCIEEPELGLHPDAIVALGRLLIDASARTQLIVTTHSDTLVDCFGETPESVVVCEKHDGQTKMTRLDKQRMSKWLDEYSLGNLWRSGQIGGNRW